MRVALDDLIDIIQHVEAFKVFLQFDFEALLLLFILSCLLLEVGTSAGITYIL